MQAAVGVAFERARKAADHRQGVGVAVAPGIAVVQVAAQVGGGGEIGRDVAQHEGEAAERAAVGEIGLRQRLAQGQVIVDLQGDRLLVIFVSRALQLKPNSFCAAA